MDLDALIDLTTKQLHDKKFKDAETNLLQARQEAKSNGDKEALEQILSLLVHVYCGMRPSEIEKAKECAHEREQLSPTAYNKLQTAMVLCWVADDYSGAIDKLKGAISQGKTENNYPAIYSSLGLLGWCFLKLNRTHEAVDVLKEIEQMILDGRRFAVGDETAFLEISHDQKVEVARVRRIAAMLAPLCRDLEFRRRLDGLAANDQQS
jgi:hypothetical protein